jgi:penicillin-binding protein 1C
VVARNVRFEPAIEPPRIEWFAAGSERAVVRLASAGLLPRIVSPTAGSIIALDPDIPPANQRLALAASAPAGARLELDGKVLGSADKAHAWFPWPGAHALRLKGPGGELLHEVTFEVRGARPRAELTSARCRHAVKPGLRCSAG